MNQPPTAGPDAHRPTVSGRLTLLPLALLVLCVLAATLVGAISDSAVSSESAPAPAAAAGAEKTAAVASERKAKDACRPGWNPATKGEPWQGSRRAQSEQAYSAKISGENPAYVRGRKGWLFFTDYQVQNFSQAVGRVVQTSAEQKAWARFLKRSQRTVEKLGSSYFVSPAPGNWAVYRQFLPTWAQKLRGSVSLDRLMAANPTINWVDTRSALRASDRLTYEPLNSHWTPYGGYVAWQAISRCLRQVPGLEGIDVPALKRVKTAKNLNEFAVNGVPDGKPQRTVPVYKKKHPKTVIRSIPGGKVLDNVPDDSVDMLLLPVRTTTKKAATNKTLLVLRDSTGSALSPLWSNSFRTTIQYNHGIGTDLADPPNLAKLVKKHKPDAVLFVFTERFLSLDPPG
jgi:hypothetical protein